MTVSSAPYVARCFHPEKRFSWRLVGVLLVAPVLLLSLNSDACGKECKTPVLENGEVYAPNNSFQFENAAHFFCNEGYYLSGKQAVVCHRRGDDVYWGDELPTCNKIYCNPPKRIKNGKYSNSHRTLFEYNELITFTCNPSNGPDEFSLVGDSKLICIDHNKWSSSPPQCKVVKCEYPVLEHGRMVSGIKNKYSYQATVLLECFPGFYMNGSNPVFCGGSSTWEPAMPKCIRGFKPTHPTKPPVSKYPGYPEPSDRLTLEDFEELDAGIIAVIVLTLLVGLAVLCTCLYRCFQRGKKGVSVKLMGLNLTLLRGMPGWLSHCLPSGALFSRYLNAEKSYFRQGCVKRVRQTVCPECSAEFLVHGRLEPSWSCRILGIFQGSAPTAHLLKLFLIRPALRAFVITQPQVTPPLYPCLWERDSPSSSLECMGVVKWRVRFQPHCHSSGLARGLWSRRSADADGTVLRIM
ncbi:membrane cofactor protein-like [Lontra canadensis]|uniref:membrane cofactor protein-like n=1 Tax=Lontra canadensis TaxID=76717 RepID=UPI0013F319EC|nr:membrane cofactor protein-like [Lontra canadensis]